MAKNYSAIETESLFSQALNKRLDERDMDLLDLADRVEASYEHMRKLSRGLTSPSNLMLKEICEVLGLERDAMKRLVTADQIRSRYGELPGELTGQNPRTAKLARRAADLTDDQLASVMALVESMRKQNQAGTAKRR